MAGSVNVQQAPDPVAGLSASNNGPAEVSDSISFTALVTGGTEIVYTWDFGDDNSGTGNATTHSYSEAGIYTATVTASNATNSLTSTTTVYVGDAIVDVLDNFFDPDDVTLPAGSTVVWVLNEGLHSVTADDGSFNQSAGTDWSPFVQTFNTPDLYDYHCTIHGNAGGIGMAGRVRIEASDPIIGLTANNDGPTEIGNTTAFTAAVSSGTNIAYNWDFGDGNSGAGITTTHTYSASGLYTATVIAANDVSSVTATTTVYVGDAIVDVGPSNFFVPDDVAIPSGGTVVWVWRGGFHSVTADDGSFNQPAGTDWPPFVQTFGTAASTFATTAVQGYYCTIHGAPGGFGMSGRVVVGSDSMYLPNVRQQQPPE
jgi:plastocyanin